MGAMHHGQHVGLRLKLGLLLFLLFVLPTIAFGGIILVQFQHILENSVYARQEAELEGIAVGIDQLLIDLDRIGRALSFDIAFSQRLARRETDFADADSWLRFRDALLAHATTVVAMEPRVRDFVILPPQSPPLAGHGLSIELELLAESVAEVRSGTLIAWPRAYTAGDSVQRIGFVTHLPVFDLGRKRVDRAAFVLVLDLGDLSRVVQRYAQSIDRFFLYDHHGTLLYASDAQVAFKTIPGSLGSRVVAEWTGREVVETATGGRALASFTTSRFGTVKLIAHTSRAFVDQNLSVLTRFTLAFLIALVGLLVVFVVYFSRAIAAPISQLERAVDRLEATQFHVDAIGLPPSGGLLHANFAHVFQLLNEIVRRMNDYHRWQKEQELLILQAQINPHFVYNTLNTIRVMAQIRGEQQLAGAIQSLIHLLKSSIRIGQVFIPIREEVAQIRDYVALQRMRYDNSFECTYEVDEDALDCTTIKFALQPIVENAIFHGIGGDTVAGRLSVTIVRRGDRIHYAVADTGKGIDPAIAEEALRLGSQANPAAKIGIRNVNARLIEHFGPHSAMSITGGANFGTVVTYTIPALPYEAEAAS